MAEDYPAAGVCGENWWMNASKSAFTGCGGPSTCSTGIIGNDLGAYGSYNWSSCKDYLLNNNSNNIIHSNIISTIEGSSDFPVDHNFMGFNLTSSSSSSSSPDWNQLLIGNTSNTGRGDAYATILEEDMDLGLDPSPEIRTDWTSTTSDHSRSSTSGGPDRRGRRGGEDDEDHFLDQQISIDNNPTATCQGLSSSGFHRCPTTYGHPSLLIQTLFELDPISPPHHPQQQQSLLINDRSSTNFFGSDHLDHEPSSCWPNTSSSGFHFSSNTSYWNASASSSFDDNINGAGNFFPSSRPQIVATPALQEKSNCSNLTAKIKNEEATNLGSVAKKGSEPAFKRLRIETPSPLPTFKVRKEKLGDRITALQQLVSPFGKTDTASVLHEAIDYIKYLHDQVNVLSIPYMKNPNPTQHQLQQDVDDLEGTKQDLRSRGLCLVPISSTFPVANETTGDFWTPTFGGTF